MKKLITIALLSILFVFTIAIVAQKRTPDPIPVYVPQACSLADVPTRYLNLAADSLLAAGCYDERLMFDGANWDITPIV